MIIETLPRRGHVIYEAAANAAQLSLDIREPRRDDLGYLRWSFAESHKLAPGVSSMTWRYYKRFIAPELDRVLAYPTTELLAAYLGGTIVGWLAFARGRRVDTVHWAFTRHSITDRASGDAGSRGAAHPLAGLELRRRGVMTALFDAAQLGQRIAYTWKGSYARHDRDGKTMDERLLPWLAGRGQHAAYVGWEEWVQ